MKKEEKLHQLASEVNSVSEIDTFNSIIRYNLTPDLILEGVRKTFNSKYGEPHSTFITTDLKVK